MARRKKSSAPRKRRRSRRKGLRAMSESGLSRRGKRRTTRRRRRGMSEAFTVGTVKETGKAILSGAVGGFGAGALIPKMLGKYNTPGGSLIAHTVASFLTGAVLGWQNVGAGIAGAYGSKLASGSMAENYNYANQDALNEMPDAMDEDGNAMYLADDGNFYYLEELQDAMELAAGNDNAYPDYVNSSMY